MSYCNLRTQPKRPRQGIERESLTSWLSRSLNAREMSLTSYEPKWLLIHLSLIGQTAARSQVVGCQLSVVSWDAAAEQIPLTKDH